MFVRARGRFVVDLSVLLKWQLESWQTPLRLTKPQSLTVEEFRTYPGSIVSGVIDEIVGRPFHLFVGDDHSVSHGLHATAPQFRLPRAVILQLCPWAIVRAQKIVQNKHVCHFRLAYFFPPGRQTPFSDGVCLLGCLGDMCVTQKTRG